MNRLKGGKKNEKKQKQAGSNSPKGLIGEEGKRKLALSVKKVGKGIRIEDDNDLQVKLARQKGKRESVEASLINRSYDEGQSKNAGLPRIEPKKQTVERRLKGIAGKYRSVAPGKLSMDDIMKENELLRNQNMELLKRIAELEGKHSDAKGGVQNAKEGIKGDKIFEYERKIKNLELNQQAMQIKLTENDKLISQLLQAIDYLNQGAVSSGKKAAKPGIDNKITVSLPEPEAKSGQFLFNKSELVQSHTQIKQTKYMIFEGFKTLQGEIVAKYGTQGAIVGIIDYLLGNLDTLFNILHQLEIKELQYLNLLAQNQPAEKDASPAAKPRKANQ